MRPWLKNVALIVQAFGQIPVIFLAEVILPGLRLYSVAEYLANKCYSRSRQSHHRDLALAHVYEKAGRIDRAEESLRRAVAMRSNVPDNYLFLGQFLARQKRPLDAIRAFEQAISVAQDRPTDLEYARKWIDELRRVT